MPQKVDIHSKITKQLGSSLQILKFLKVGMSYETSKCELECFNNRYSDIAQY